MQAMEAGDRSGMLISALEHAPTGIAVLADHGGVVWVNRRLARMLRRDADDLVGWNLGELMHPEDHLPEELEPDGLVEGRFRDCGRKRFERPDGTHVWAGLTLSPFAPAGHASDAPHLVANIAELTELVRAEERLALIVAGLDDGIVSIDPHGRIAGANPAAERILGPLGAPLTGLDLAEVPWRVVDEDGAPLAPEDRPELVALATGEPAFATIGLLHDGIERWVSVAAHPLQRSPDQRWVAATYKDVSERLRIEAALREAEATDRAKSEFLSRMSHELRTPLNSVLGFAQLMRIDDLAPSHQEAVDQILKAGRHLLGLLDEVLDLERIQSGHLEVNLAPTAIAATLQEAVELVQPLAVASGIAIDLRLGRDGGALVLADEQRVRQVVINLLTNGVKFNRPHGRVTVTTRLVDDTLVIRVHDTGAGIAPEDVEQIFLPFERLDAARRGIDGAGVGLALAKQITEAMGGAIGVVSEPGEGSTFFVVLRTVGPEYRVEPPPVTAELLSEVLARTDAKPRRVLYIEDNLDSRRLMERIATLHGSLDLELAGSVREGLERARATLPHAILLDIHLPDGTGDEVMTGLQEDPATRDTPVIVLTADATPKRRRELIAAGAVAYLTKPVDLSELFTALEVALDGR
jgi:PAS domain S-box-containing protein